MDNFVQNDIQNLRNSFEEVVYNPKSRKVNKTTLNDYLKLDRKSKEIVHQVSIKKRPSIANNTNSESNSNSNSIPNNTSTTNTSKVVSLTDISLPKPNTSIQDTQSSQLVNTIPSVDIKSNNTDKIYFKPIDIQHYADKLNVGLNVDSNYIIKDINKHYTSVDYNNVNENNENNEDDYDYRYDFPSNKTENESIVEKFKDIKETNITSGGTGRGKSKSKGKSRSTIINNQLDLIPTEFKKTECVCNSDKGINLADYIGIYYYQNKLHPNYIMKYIKPRPLNSNNSNNGNNSEYYYDAREMMLYCIETEFQKPIIIEYDYQPNSNIKFKCLSDVSNYNNINNQHNQDIIALFKDYEENENEFPKISDIPNDVYILVYVNGYNYFGMDQDGYDRKGIDVFGYNRDYNFIGDFENINQGYDINGINRYYFNEDGYDILGRNIDDIDDSMKDIKELYKPTVSITTKTKGGKVRDYEYSNQIRPTDYFIVNNYSKIERIHNKQDEYEFRFGRYVERELKGDSKKPKKSIKEFKSDIGYIKFGKIFKYCNDQISKGLFEKHEEETLSVSFNSKDERIPKKFNNYRIILNKEHIYHYYMNNFMKYYTDVMKVYKKIKTKYTHTFESYDYNMRFSHSIEELCDKNDNNVNDLLYMIDGQEKQFRYRKRYSYTRIDQDTSKKMYRLDLTIVRSNKTPSKSLNEIKDEDYVYEYQLELELLQPLENEEYRIYNVDEIMKELIMYRVIIDDNGYFVSNSDKKHILEIYKKQCKLTNIEFVGPKPEGFDLNKAKRIDDSYSITIKADGERHLLMILPKDKTKYSKNIFLINNRMDIIPLGYEITQEDLGFCLLDGEYLEYVQTNENIFYIFDILFYKNKDVRDLHFYEQNQKQTRYNLISEFTSILGRNDSKTFVNYLNSNVLLKQLSLNDQLIKTEILMKPTKIPSIENKSIVKLYDEMKKEEQKSSIRNDGYILTKMNQPYPKEYKKSWENCFKLKPKHLNTIDFMVDEFTKIVMNGVSFIKMRLNCSRFNQNRFEFVPFQLVNSVDKLYSFKQEQISYMYVPIENDIVYTINDKLEIFNGSIIECSWHTYKNQQECPFKYGWYPLRMRLDKVELFLQHNMIRGTANNINIAKSIWNELNEPEIQFEKLLKGYFGVKLAEKEIKEFEEVRKYHRNIKKDLLKTYSSENTKLIDFTCGRGSDMRNWLDCEIKNVIGLDIDYDSIYLNNKDGIYWRFTNSQKKEILQNYNYLFLNFNSASDMFYSYQFPRKKIEDKTGSKFLNVLSGVIDKSYIHTQFFSTLMNEYNRQTYYLYNSKSYIDKQTWDDENKIEFNRNTIQLFKPILIDKLKQYDFGVDSSEHIFIENDKKFNIATNFFSVHYFFNDKQDILKLINNVSEILIQNVDFKKSGKWCITCMNGDRLLNYFNTSIFVKSTNVDISKTINNNTITYEIPGIYTRNEMYKKCIFKSTNYTFTEIERLFENDFVDKYISCELLQDICTNYENQALEDQDPNNQLKTHLRSIFISKVYEKVFKKLDHLETQENIYTVDVDTSKQQFKEQFQSIFRKHSKLVEKAIGIEYKNVSQSLFKFFDYLIKIESIIPYHKVRLYDRYREINNSLKLNFAIKPTYKIQYDNDKCKIEIECKQSKSNFENDIRSQYLNTRNVLMNVINDILFGNKIKVKVSSISNIGKEEPLVFDFGLNLYTRYFGLVSENNKNIENFDKYIEQIQIPDITLDRLQRDLIEYSTRLISEKFKENDNEKLLHIMFYKFVSKCENEDKDNLIPRIVKYIQSIKLFEKIPDDFCNELVETFLKFTKVSNYYKEIDKQIQICIQSYNIEVPIEFKNQYYRYYYKNNMNGIPFKDNSNLNSLADK